jgi:DNA-binding beta-propeller fold protein YncE
VHCRNHKTLWVAGCSAVLFTFLPAAFGQTLKKIAAVDLPGPPGKRFDYLTIDYEDHYLLSAHLAAGILYVIGTADNRLVKAIPGVPGVEGVEYVPGLKIVYTSDSSDDTIGVVDLRAMKVIKRLAAAAKPDGSAYAEPFRKLYVSDERGKAEAIIDVDKDEILRTLKFDSELVCRSTTLSRARYT